MFDEEFVQALSWRWRSWPDWISYSGKRNRILACLSERKVERRKPSSRKAAATRRRKTSGRDVEMALEYVHDREPNGSTVSYTALMIRIGERYDLTRSPSIDAVKRGLKRLGIPIAGNWDDCKRFQEQNCDAWSAYWNSRDKPGNRGAALVQLMRQLNLA